MDLQCIRYVSFEGGGLTGRRYIGLIRALQFVLGSKYTAWHHNLQGICGTSVGAIVGLYFLLNAKDSLLSNEFIDMLCNRETWIKHPDFLNLFYV